MENNVVYGAGRLGRHPYYLSNSDNSVGSIFATFTSCNFQE